MKNRQPKIILTGHCWGEVVSNEGWQLAIHNYTYSTSKCRKSSTLRPKKVVYKTHGNNSQFLTDFQNAATH